MKTQYILDEEEYKFLVNMKNLLVSEHDKDLARQRATLFSNVEIKQLKETLE